MNGDEVRHTWFLDGHYAVSEVDDLLRRVAAELDAGRPAGPLKLTDELVLAIAISAKWLESYFGSSSSGAGGVGGAAAGGGGSFGGATNTGRQLK